MTFDVIYPFLLGDRYNGKIVSLIFRERKVRSVKYIVA